MYLKRNQDFGRRKIDFGTNFKFLMKIMNFDAIWSILENRALVFHEIFDENHEFRCDLVDFQKSGSENPIPKFEIESR